LARPAPATARSIALVALVEIAGSGRANVVLPTLLAGAGLSGRDRAFATELVYGTVRMQRACDWLVDRHVRRPLDPQIRAAVRLGAYQLAFLGTPAHAAVSATVAEVVGPGRTVVNAVLRRVAADVAAGRVRWPNLATELSYPDWLVARLEDDLGPASARAALAEMNRPGAMTVRPDGYVQDMASQWVAAAVAAGAGDGSPGTIADLCAAPGGKATALAYGWSSGDIAWPRRAATAGAPPSPASAASEVFGTSEEDDSAGPPDPFRSPADDRRRPATDDPDRPVVVAADVDLTRTTVISANAGRLGLDNVHAVTADGRRPPFRPASFDRVLVDAPCSGLGVLRRRPDARWRVQPSDVRRLAALQRRLLEEALPLVRPGGLLFYSVCTLTRAETAAIDRWLLRAHPEARPVLPALDPAWQRAGRGTRLLPQTAGTDGMFLLALRVGDRVRMPAGRTAAR
jgi:16S rRNA (cytosine967-C5)-methyltransferase